MSWSRRAAAHAAAQRVLAEVAADPRYARTSHLHLRLEGAVVVDEHLRGPLRADVFSVTKSVLSTVLGVMAARRLLPDLDRPVAEVLPPLRGTPAEAHTWRQLLTMTRGAAVDGRWERDRYVRAAASARFSEVLEQLPYPRRPLGAATRSGRTICPRPSRLTGTSPISTTSILATPSTATSQITPTGWRRWLSHFGCAAPTRPDGRWPGGSPCMPGCAMLTWRPQVSATSLPRYLRRSRRLDQRPRKPAASTATCSVPILRSRSTATSA